MIPATWNRTALIAGFCFLLLGIVFLLDEMGVIALEPAYILPLILIVLGVAVVLGAVLTARHEPPRPVR